MIKYCNRIHMLLCCVLCIATILSACTPAPPAEPGTPDSFASSEGQIIPVEGDTNAMGRYVEQETILPAELAGNYLCSGFKRVGDDILYVATRMYDSTAPSQALIYKMAEDGSFTDVTPDWLKAPNTDIPQDFRLIGIDFFSNGDA